MYIYIQSCYIEPCAMFLFIRDIILSVNCFVCLLNFCQMTKNSQIFLGKIFVPGNKFGSQICARAKNGINSIIHFLCY